MGGFPRPQLDLSSHNFAKLMDEAFGYHLDPPFDPYCNSLNYMLASYVIPYMGLIGYVGTNPNLKGYRAKRVKIFKQTVLLHKYIYLTQYSNISI